MSNERFTREELAIAKDTDLCEVATSLGYTIKRIGNYHTVKEMDSIRIYNRRSWFRFSRQYESGERGGSQIDFLKTFAGLETKEAVFWLLDFAGYRRLGGEDRRLVFRYQAPKVEEEKKEFILPAPAPNNHFLYSYLEQERAISKEVIDYFVNKRLIYESREYHNIVFKGNDKDGKTRFASMRGIYDRNGKSFKGDVAGNDKSYGFSMVNESSSTLIVFEAAIDSLSYVDIVKDYESNLLAFGMLSDAPLTTFLSEYPQIQEIKFCLDNDEPGRKAVQTLMKKYYELGYEVTDCPPPPSCKDYNEWLKAIKEQISPELNHPKIGR